MKRAICWASKAVTGSASSAGRYCIAAQSASNAMRGALRNRGLAAHLRQRLFAAER